jgi:DNA-binding transcriptional regulator/RsmH inhibitor MraZ
MALPSRSSARYGLAGNAKAVFVGMGDRFELWEEGAHDAFMANFSEDPGALADMPWPET